MAEHTPGPWHIEPGNIPGTPSVKGPHGQAIAAFGNQRRSLPYSEIIGNAHLIAAAPDLLAACEALLTVASEYDWRWSVPSFLEEEPAVADLRAAIAKAKGE